jgi:hypothetical protein
MKELNSKASDLIFEQRNRPLQDEKVKSNLYQSTARHLTTLSVLDVHGLHVSEALARVEAKLKDLQASRSKSSNQSSAEAPILDIVVGTGLWFPTVLSLSLCLC